MSKIDNYKDQDHIGLVYKIAKELAVTNEACIRAFGNDVSEYLGEGYLALDTAKKNFNPNLGYQFSTYASAVIRDRLIQAARKSTLIKVSFQARYHAARSIQGKEVKPEDADKVADALKIMCNGLLNIAEHGEKGRMDDDPFWEVSEELTARLRDLDERTKSIIIMRYGLDGNPPQTLGEVGDKLNPRLTRERVRQIERDGLKKLKGLINF